MENYCGNAGRGSHPLAMRSAETVFAARESVAALFGAESENVVFTLNTTYALNMAIKGIMSGGGHMLISNMEHNSTLRPVEKLKRERRIRYDVFKAYDGGLLSPKAITDDISQSSAPIQSSSALYTPQTSAPPPFP
jgi:selenocysteine lyase/cysteine desulfurase